MHRLIVNTVKFSHTRNSKIRPLDVLDILNDGFPRQYNWDRPNHFDDLPELAFFRRFRLTKPTVEDLLEEVDDALSYDSNVNNPLSPMDNLLLALRFFASNGHQLAVADFMGCSQPTVSRVLNKVSRAIATLRPIHVKMSQTDEEKLRTQEKFYRIARFPRVQGVIDCTHVKILSPGGADHEVFRNRKNYFSINVQLVGNADLEINDVVARWPGSAHDATIFSNSTILNRFENGEFREGLLLGDSGYGLRFLMTPLLNPHTRGEMLYNEAHIRTRNIIERINEILKRRFPVLAYGMRCKIENVLPIIVAATVLHNKARRMGEEVPPLPDDIDPVILEYLIEQGDIPEMADDHDNPRFVNHRQQIINNFFIHLQVV